MMQLGKFSKKSRFYFWLRKARKEYLVPEEKGEDYEISNATTLYEEVGFWKKIGSPYEHALALFEGAEDDKRKALLIIQQLGGDAVYKKMKMEMRSSGIKKIPRGLRESTKSNPAELTNRELDVLLL